MPALATAIDPGWKVTIESLRGTEEGRRIWSCLQCGTCAGTCPHGEYMDYPPRRIIKMLQAGRIQEVFESDSILKCVTCYSCTTKCPRDIKLTDILLPLVKEQALVRLAEMPNELKKAIEATYRYGNPMGESGRKRTAWVAGAGVPIRTLDSNPTPVDVLWFVECYYSYHPRGQAGARAMARIFHALGTDFAILGNQERCAGDCGRLSWEPGLSEMLIDYNMTILGKHLFNRIVTSDPHALDAFKFKYTMFGFNYAVEHAVPFFHRNLGKLKPLLKVRVPRTVTYHDSCCLGRHNGLYDEPRALLRAIPGVKLVEMTHNRENALCCGGGGGGMWLDTYYKSKGMERLSDRRIKEAIDTKADVLAVACPYEVSRFEDSLKVAGHEGKMVVRDVLEMIAESLGGN